KEATVKKLLAILAFLAFVAAPVAGHADDAPHADAAKHVTVRPDAVHWGPGPPSLPPGVQMAVLVGDPSKAGGPYVIRAKMADGYKVPPHWHPSDENVTVLHGTLLMGEGETLDPSRAAVLPVGSFTRMPKTMRHFAIAKGETVIQLH